MTNKTVLKLIGFEFFGTDNLELELIFAQQDIGSIEVNYYYYKKYKQIKQPCWSSALTMLHK